MGYKKTNFNKAYCEETILYIKSMGGDPDYWKKAPSTAFVKDNSKFWSPEQPFEYYYDTKDKKILPLIQYLIEKDRHEDLRKIIELDKKLAQQWLSFPILFLHGSDIKDFGYPLEYCLVKRKYKVFNIIWDIFEEGKRK